MSEATATEPDADLTAAEVAWDLDSLLDGKDADALLDEADRIADALTEYRGRVAILDAGELAQVMADYARMQELASRAGHYVMLRYSENTGDPERGAAMAANQERATEIGTKVLFLDLEWAAADPAHAEAVEADERLAFCAHHLGLLRQNQAHLLTEVEETILTEKSVTGASAWVRLFSELTSAIEVDLPGEDEPMALEGALSRLQHPDSETRKIAAEAVTAALEPGLRTRAFVFNNLLLDKSVNDRLRKFPTWVSSRNLSNEATDESVQALVDAVVGRYDIPQRWYALKAKVLGVDRIADFDRMASVADSDEQIGWAEATGIVRDAYASFSEELAGVVGRFIDESWIDAPVRPGKRPGAFCAYSVPSDHPYVFLNWTGRTRDVLTLAHELGHGVHAYLAREQGIFQQATPLTLAETASVFGETVTNNRLLSMIDDPGERFALLASTLEDSIATVFRQVAMNRFEDAVHIERRDVGELSTDRFGELWYDTQTAMLGDAVEVTDGYRSWWSYIPHFIGTPGYVYAYAYGQLLALSVYARYAERGDAFVPMYLDLLRAGGSRSPEELGAIVDCDLADPGFWDAGLAIVEGQLTAAEEAAEAAGRL
ncbi:MAG: M3 family oligoendopeptidase [Actinomycetota bacterium]